MVHWRYSDQRTLLGPRFNVRVIVMEPLGR
jgi:hypothetical protein